MGGEKTNLTFAVGYRFQITPHFFVSLIMFAIQLKQVPGKINLVLEYCRGGDLFMYIQRHGKVPEALAKHFMQQLGLPQNFYCFRSSSFSVCIYKELYMY